MGPKIKPQPQSKDKKAESDWGNTAGKSDAAEKAEFW